jgi:hypothetical protein
MQLFQRFRELRSSLSSGIEPRQDPRCQDPVMNALYPGADLPAPPNPPVYWEDSVTNINFPVP